jgi:hypothetical protein
VVILGGRVDEPKRAKEEKREGRSEERERRVL